MSIENKGFDEEIAKWDAFPKVFTEELNREAKKLAKTWLGRMREETPRRETGQLRPGWRMKVTIASFGIEILLFNNVHYAPHWNYGHRVKVWGRFTGHVVQGTYKVEETRREVYKDVPGAIKSALARTEGRLKR